MFSSNLYPQNKCTLETRYTTYKSICDVLGLEDCSKQEENTKEFYLKESDRLEKMVKKNINQKLRFINLPDETIDFKAIIDALNSRIDRCNDEKEKLQMDILIERERYRLLEDELDRKEKMKTETAESYEDLINRMKRGYSNSYYGVSALPEDELVIGKKGLYFAVDLKDPVLEKTLYFIIEEYTIDQFDKIYRSSINRFYFDVIDIINKENNIKYEIFIKGGADVDHPPKFKKQLLKRYNFNEVNILHRHPESKQYLFNEKLQAIPKLYENKHLPNLRANFLKTVLGRNPYSFTQERLHILNGSIVKFKDKDYRNVVLYLYVKG